LLTNKDTKQENITCVSHQANLPPPDGIVLHAIEYKQFESSGHTGDRDRQTRSLTSRKTAGLPTHR